MPLRRKKSEKGQVLLIVVLASVISLTVGLAAISRSITNTRISTEESNSQKALSAAEAGIEEQINKVKIATDINNVSGSTGGLNNKSSFDASALAVSGNNFVVNNGEVISQDDGADVWLSKYPDFSSPTSPRITVYWNATGACNSQAAIEVAVISGDRNSPGMSRYAVDPCSSRAATNGFASPNAGSTTINGTNFNVGYQLPVVSNGYIARVIPLYASTTVGVRSTQSLPPQGFAIESTGVSGNTRRKVRVYQGFPKLPVEFFPYNLFVP